MVTQKQQVLQNSESRVAVCQRKCMHGIQLLQTETIRHSKEAQSLSTICLSLRVVNKMDGRQYSYEKYQIYSLIIYTKN